MAVCSIAIAAGVMGVALALKGLFFRRSRGGGPWALSGCGPAGFAGSGPCGSRSHHRWGRGSRGPGGSFWLRALFSRLDTTPGQEREIRGAVEDLQNRARDAKDALKSARADLARAIRGADLDEAALHDASGRADGATAQIKEAMTAALRRIHGVLDDKQRERLADLLANGPSFRTRWGGPYRESL
jgi:Spy/CpxP family protein refolding chaperone